MTRAAPDKRSERPRGGAAAPPERPRGAVAGPSPERPGGGAVGPPPEPDAAGWAGGASAAVRGVVVRIAAELGALVAPPGCVGCRAPTGRPEERLCPACVRALPWLRAGCPRCGLPAHRGR